MARHVEVKTYTEEYSVCDICGTPSGLVPPYGTEQCILGKPVKAIYNLALEVDGAPVHDLCIKCKKQLLQQILNRMMMEDV